MSLRESALRILRVEQVETKLFAVSQLELDQDLAPDLELDEPENLPGRPDRPQLVAPSELTHRSVQSKEGHQSLIHAIAHIEMNAVNLALDIVWRFPNMPRSFYLDWLKVAKEEAYHFTLLRDHLRSMGGEYGDFPAHNGLWEMVEKTKSDVLARLALVPRTLEARGLDVSPAIRAKLLGVGDKAGASILDIILHDEIGHVAIGNHWYKYLCNVRGLDPIRTYEELVLQYQAPRLRGPFNIEARRAAGFDDAELAALSDRSGSFH